MLVLGRRLYTIQGAASTQRESGESITKALVDGASPSGFEDHVESKPEYIRQWNDDPIKVMKVTTKADKEGQVVRISVLHRASRGGPKPSKVGGSSSRSSKKGDKKKDGDHRPRGVVSRRRCGEGHVAVPTTREGGRLRQRCDWLDYGRRLSEWGSQRRICGTIAVDRCHVGACPRTRRPRCRRDGWRRDQRGARRDYPPTRCPADGVPTVCRAGQRSWSWDDPPRARAR